MDSLVPYAEEGYLTKVKQIAEQKMIGNVVEAGGNAGNRQGRQQNIFRKQSSCPFPVISYGISRILCYYINVTFM